MPPDLNRINSLQNQRIKDTVKLGKRGERDRRQCTIAEGRRETERALAAGIVPQQAFLCSEILGEARDAVLALLSASNIPRSQIFDTTPQVFAKLAYRDESGGIILVVPYFARQLNELTLGPTPLVLVVEGVEKPGNLGAILRTADAVGVDALIVTAGATDLHNPNTIRAALGASFTVPVVEASATEVQAFLKAQNIRCVATTPAATAVYWDVNLRGPLAILLGSEAHGLSDFWLRASDQQVKLPMRGAIDSLNLSTATAVVLYEALRQRSKAT